MAARGEGQKRQHILRTAMSQKSNRVDPKFKDEMNQKVYEYLKIAAGGKKTITYGELAPLAGLNMELPGDRAKLGDLLGDMSTLEHRNECGVGPRQLLDLAR